MEELNPNVFILIVTVVLWFLVFIWNTDDFLNIALKLLFAVLGFWGAAISWIWLTT